MPTLMATRPRRRRLAALNVAALALGLAVAVPTALAASPAQATPGICPAAGLTTDQALLNIVSVSGSTVTVNNRAMRPIAATTSSLAAPTAAVKIPQVEKFSQVIATPSQFWLVGVAAAGTAIASGSTSDTTGGLWVWRYANGAWGNPLKVTDSVRFKDWAGSAKNMITMDSGYNIWTVDTSGNLQMSPLDITNRTFPSGKLKLMSSEFASTNYLVAAGNSVLWSRNSAGELFRTQYDTPSARVILHRYRYGTGFNTFTTILSPGYDLLYTLTSTGAVQIWKFNFSGGSSSWAVRATATGNPLTGFKFVWAANSYCSAPADVVTPPDLNVAGTPGDAPDVVQWQTGQAGRVDLFYVNAANQLAMSSNTDRELGSGTWSRSILSDGGWVNGPATVHLDNLANTGNEVEYVFAQRYTGHIMMYARTNPLTAFSAPVDLQGRFSGAPAAVRRSDNSAAVVVAHGTQVWGRARPANSGDFAGWERIAGTSEATTPAITGDVAAAPLDNGLVAVAARGTDGKIWVGAWNPVTHATTWTALPALASVGTPALAAKAGRLRVAVTLAPVAPETASTVATIKQGLAGDWETAWTTVAGASTSSAPATGWAGYEGVWYLAATGADKALAVAKETVAGGSFGSFSGRYDITFPTPASSTEIAGSPAIFTLTNEAGKAQAAVAVVNSEGYGTAVKLNPSLNPLSHVATKTVKAKKSHKAKRTPKTTVKH